MGNVPEPLAMGLDAGPKWSAETLLGKRPWTEKMFSFTVTRPEGYEFTAGQFARLGIDDGEGGIVWRPHSMVSPAAADFLEFLTVVVPDGAFTTRMARLQLDDRVYVERMPYGFLTVDRFVEGLDLWLLASGTGIGPYLAMLAEAAPWRDYEHIIVVHSVRRAAELAYRDELAAMAAQHSGEAQFHYLPVVTRETMPGALSERVTTLIENGLLERAAGLALNPERTRLMVCGNPEMAKSLRQLLTDRGYRVDRRAVPGQLAFENYW